MSSVSRAPFVPHDIKAPIKGAASGPLAGLTAGVKDMYDIAGETTGGGNPDWLVHAKPATKTAPMVQALLDAGATVTGKTVCDEFFFSVIGANAHYGTPVNVRAKDRVPGGSSSGSASAVAAGACDLALGSDTGGSVRIPASFCGLYGIRPTHGRVDLTGAMAMAPSFDVGGWFTAGPGLFRKLGAILLVGQADTRAVSSVVLLDDAFAEADAEVSALAKTALSRMADVLPKPGNVQAAPERLDAWREAFRIVQAQEVWTVYGDFITRMKPRFGPGVRERMEFASTVSESAGAKAKDALRRATERMESLARPGTILALPTAPAIAPRIDMGNEDYEKFRARTVRMTCMASISGLPQINIPVGTVAGCPAGLSFIGWRGGDEALLDLAVAVSICCGIET